MLIESAVGASVGWLWGKLADVAEAKDSEKAIRKALEESIDQSYRQFQNKYGKKSELFFNQYFLENYACPEILKYLTRHQHPDLQIITDALPVNALFVSETGFRDEIKEFFDMIFDCMKSHAILQEIINYRQIEETNQIVKDIQEKQSFSSKLLEDKFEEILFDHKESDNNINSLTTKSADQHAELMSTLVGMQNQLAASLPVQKGNELNKFLAKQLDRARDFITKDRVDDSHDLLMSLKEEISTSDDYMRFRWHTNIGACLLSQDKRQEAAEQYLTAFNFAKDEEKAVANRIRAFLLMNNFEEGLKESEKALKIFSESGLIWALHINAKSLLKINFDISLLPDELKNNGAVLLMLSYLKLSEKKYEESFSLAKDAFELDETSNDAKRSMLASALSFATIDTVKSHYRQFTEQQRNALKFSADSFENIIDFLKNIQSKHVFTEVAHNLAVATELLGEEKLKEDITAYAFSTYPDEDAFIWYKVKQLKESGDIESIHKLTDNKYEELEKPLLFTLAEISANTGDVEWNNSVREFLATKSLDDKESNELFGTKLCAIWKSGDKTKTIELAKDNLSQIISYPSLLSFYIRILDEYGETEERDELLQSCSELPEELSSVDVIQMADLLYDFDRYFEAAALYSRIIEFPSDDYLTKRYIAALIKSDQRARASSMLEQLPNDIRSQSSFKRIEANLARASGDLGKLENILTEELKLYPFDSGIAAGYIATLYRKNKMDELNNYLATNPIYEPIIEQNEIEIAKYQMELGLEQHAMLRMYTLFRTHPSSSQIAGHFLLLMLLVKKFDTFKRIDIVTPDTAIYLESEGNKRTVVVEPRILLANAGWPECISEDSELGQRLIGLRVGDSIDINAGFGVRQSTILNVESMFIFASNLAHKVVADTASSVGPVWSVNVKKPDGEYDFSPILESVKSRNKHVEHVFSIYDESKLPLQMLSDALGSDIVTLLLEWPYKQYDLFVCAGIGEEREYIKETINKDEKPYVLDLSCLVELKRLGFLQESLEIFGKPLVTASLKEQLLGLIQIHSKMKSAGIASEIDGQLTYQEIPKEHFEERGQFLNSLLGFVDNYCEIVPVIGPKVVTEPQTAISEHIGYFSHDVIYLTLERDAILVSEDGGFRSLAMGMGVTSSVWLQPLLMILRDRKILTEEQYSKSILDKLNRRHNFTSVEANDLLWAAKSNPDSISPEVESALQTFRNPTLDLASGVVVGSQFLKMVAEHVKPNTLYEYYKIILEALSFGREVYADDIHESLRAHIVSCFPSLERKKISSIKKKFGSKLLPQTIVRQRPRFKPVVQAIKVALRDWLNYKKN